MLSQSWLWTGLSSGIRGGASDNIFYLLHVKILLNPEDGGDVVLRNFD